MCSKRLATLGLVFGTMGLAHAQLAITEIVSSSSLTLGSNAVVQHSDWWELSNFGTNAIDLTGYSWNDNSGGVLGADPLPFQGLTIQPGESVLIVETVIENGVGVVTNEAQFRAWWGTNLGTNVQIRLYTGNGLSSGGDGVRLWAPDAVNDADVADSVDFDAAVRGSSFSYDTNTGLFNLFSTNGVHGAFTAVETDDVGSPGVHQGPVPLTISQDPASQSVNPGDNATFTVTVRGLPRPRFQWKFNNVDIPGERFSSLTVTNVQTSTTGLYQVVVFNGFQMLTSSNATLLLNAAPEPPALLSPLEDQTIYLGQSATFTIVASGVPQPRYQWRFNDGILIDATDSSYTVSGASLANVGVYSVVISNSLGVLTNQAALAVTPRPNLVITEVQSSESTNGAPSGHNDWWELTNFDSFAVDLYHYRFDDSSSLRAAAFTITNHVFIAPGESVVFAESMSSDSFRRWWGAANLKPDLQIIRYQAAGLGLSSAADGVVLWNPGAADDSDIITGTSFGPAVAGVTFGYNPDTDNFGDLSVLGVFGAFRAVESDDIGSPGYLRTPPEPRILSLMQSANGLALDWYGFSNRTYAIEFKNDLADATWTPLTNVIATNVITTVPLPGAPTPTDRRFYRMSLSP